jgi:BASS family bile acid:Na+ symporter
MMLATGLCVRVVDSIGVARDERLLIGAGLANYVAVPVAAIILLVLMNADPMAAAGILILAVCPGAPYGPPLTALAGGKIAVSVGLMIILAVSSVLMTPVLLFLLLPLTSRGISLHVDPPAMLGVILAIQLLPLCLGLAVSHWRPDLAARLLTPAVAVGKVLNAATFTVILITHGPQLLDIQPSSILAMVTLLGVSILAGWSAGGRGSGDRKAVALTTSMRNVGLGLVIAASGFAGPSAVAAVVAYGLVQLLASFLLALWWRWAPSLAVRPDDQTRAQ